jgi:hypothetical protein
MLDAYRIPSISVDVRGRNPELAQAMTSLVLPSRISPTHLPLPYPPQSFDQFIEGWSAVVDAVTWQVSFNCSPYIPWRVFVLEDATLGRLDAVGSALSAPVTSTATSLAVVTTPGPAWTTAGGDVPFDINLEGEKCTVTNVVAGSGATIGRVGAFISSSALGAADFNGAYTNWQSITGITLPVTRWYQAQGDFSIGTNLSQMVSASIKVCLTLRPDYATLNPAHITAIDTMLASLKASGANVNVTLWHEPYYSGLTAAQFVALVRYYGPTVRKYYPLWVVYSGPDAVAVNGFYPGDLYCDGVAVDAYALSGTGQIINAQSIADTGGKPFGCWEFNGGADLGSPLAVQGQTQAVITAHFQYLQNLFSDRLTAGKLNGDLLFFSAGTSNFLGTSLSNAAGFESTIANWVNAGGCTIARVTTQHNSGVASLALTATSTSNMLASHTPVLLANLTANALPVVPGNIVMASAWFKAATVGRSCQTAIYWYDSAAGALGSNFSGTVSDNTSTWTNVINSATAPTSAAFAVLRVQVVSPAGAGEVHWVDDGQIAILPATNDLDSAIQFPWDYRIGLLSTMQGVLDATSFPQIMTVTRSVNGVSKTHAVGTAVSLWMPGVLAL